jgi:seryl-tRNA synthetase
VIDQQILRQQPELVRASLRKRGGDEKLVDAAVAADERRRATIAAFDELRSEQKTLGRSVASAQGEEKAALLARTKQLSADVKEAEAAQTAAEAEFDAAMLPLPNFVEDGAPEGGEDDYVVLEEVLPPEGRLGVERAPDFAIRDHVEIGRMLAAIDLERGAKVSGSRFYFLTGVGARLHAAMLQYAAAYALRNGFTPVLPPVLVRPEAMAGTGYLDQTADDNVYSLPKDDLYLVGTSEVPIAAYHSEEILDAASLPLRYSGTSPCFRREAGAHGKDTRGVIRVHQFDKVEMFVFCPPEQAQAEHQRILELEKGFLSSLGLPFRVIDTAAGDLGLSAMRKYDCEAWFPSQGKYRELTSTSNCGEFQARRLRVRMRDEQGTRPVATLNGTLIAVPRALVPVLENNQQADGSVVVPEVLRPFLGEEVLRPV